MVISSVQELLTHEKAMSDPAGTNNSRAVACTEVAKIALHHIDKNLRKHARAHLWSTMGLDEDGVLIASKYALIAWSNLVVDKFYLRATEGACVIHREIPDELVVDGILSIRDEDGWEVVLYEEQKQTTAHKPKARKSKCHSTMQELLTNERAMRGGATRNARVNATAYVIEAAFHHADPAIRKHAAGHLHAIHGIEVDYSNSATS